MALQVGDPVALIDARASTGACPDPGGNARKFRRPLTFAGMALATPARALPNLLVIGAAKCGTTSLHRYLDSHPEVSMASPSHMGGAANDFAGKEMRFFSA